MVKVKNTILILNSFWGIVRKEDRYLNGLYIRFVDGGMYEAWNVQVVKNIARIKKYYRRGY